MSVLYNEGREKESREECTRDPIFLLQSRRFEYPNIACEQLDVLIEDEGWVRDDDGDGEIFKGKGEDAERVTDMELAGMGYAIDFWDTERVFFMREEAEEWATARSYNYPNGWRVYCVCAEGVLRQILKDGAKKRYDEKQRIRQMTGRFKRDNNDVPVMAPVETPPSMKKWWQR